MYLMDLQERIIEIDNKLNINLRNMGIFGDIISWIKNAISRLVGFIKKVINGIFNFAKHMVSYFKNLNLNQEEQTPFIANANTPEFKQMLGCAPKKNVGIFQGVYNDQTEEIEHAEYIEADKIDSKTKDVLGRESLVVLN
ncbi:MAG: hypothetical protein UF067_09535 [Paludibacteraceae bacterium]|nr:hypothetical protein [Paludibacteraceae bacterium]